MKSLVKLSILFFIIFNSIVIGEQCNHDPFPPFPPSPAEFQNPVGVMQQGSSAVLSWASIVGDGYTVLLCKDGRFSPLKHGIKATDLIVQDFGLVGHQEFLVMAYVKVGSNLVFNSGAIGFYEFEEFIKKESSSDEVEVQLVDKVVPNSEKVSLSSQMEAISALPDFNGAHSFYSTKYPQVKNPFQETTLETGEIVPPLLLDADIDATVARVFTKMPIQIASGPGMPSPINRPDVDVLSGSLTPDSMGVKVEKPSETKSGKNGIVSSPNVSDSSDSQKENSDKSENEKSNDSSNIMIIIVIVILIVFFQLFKEGK
ncbi:MAG: hypothetical protein COB02_11145 [Candidatus Cloacimonadota bacterium]|nr:MAG: hypothetical protein COB02_11145 [Candidatus Cloacimonadota bacterium]